MKAATRAKLSEMLDTRHNIWVSSLGLGQKLDVQRGIFVAELQDMCIIHASCYSIAAHALQWHCFGLATMSVSCVQVALVPRHIRGGVEKGSDGVTDIIAGGHSYGKKERAMTV